MRGEVTTTGLALNEQIRIYTYIDIYMHAHLVAVAVTAAYRGPGGGRQQTGHYGKAREIGCDPNTVPGPSNA